MAPLPPNATQDDIEEELDFNAVLISSLDQGADDYNERLAELEKNKSELERRLDILQSQGRAAGMDSHDDRPSWWQLPPGDDQLDNNEVHDSVLSFDGSLDVPSGGMKRSRADSIRLDSQHPSKRLTPEPSKTVTPASSVESFEANENANSELEERVRRRQLTVEAALKRQRESELADEQFARDLSQQQAQSRVNGLVSSSSQKPTFQTTLSHDGSYRRPPPPVKVEAEPSTPQGRDVNLGSVPKLSRSVVESLVKLGEPRCSSDWLRMCFVEDPTSVISFRTLWKAYGTTFSPFAYTTPLLGSHDLFRNLHSIFPRLIRPLPGEDKYSLRGIRARETPALDTFVQPVKVESSASTMPSSSIPQQPTPYIKPEPGSSKQAQSLQPRRPADVIDLTGSDSDGEEITEIAPNGFTPNNRTPRPVLTNPLALRTAQPQAPVYRQQMPRAYPPLQPPTNSLIPAYQPNMNQNGYQSVYGAVNGLNTPPQNANQYLVSRMLSSAANGARTVANTFGDSLTELGNIINGSSVRPQADTRDDDIIFGGSRQVRPNGYGPPPLPPGHQPYAGYGDRDLYQRRFNEIADYNPEKTKEEINALLENIRPDEEIPAHLRVKTPEAMTIKLHKYQELGLTWLKNCEEGTNKGGILADDMGLGKTIQMLALIVERRSEDERCKTTLIVAPVALMRQWAQEIEQKIKPTRQHRLRVYTHHKQAKKKSFQELRQNDIVLTTYGTLGQELKNLEKFRLRQKYDPAARPNAKEQTSLLGDDSLWYRVILDEAQCIKNKSTQTHKAACLINAKYRFCMTGTPMMNNIEEFYSLVKFVRIRPYQHWDKFRVDISTPLKSGSDDSRASAMAKLQALCKAIMLRRTKKSTFEGQPILVLPERTTQVENPEFDDEEMAFYQSVEGKTQLQFNKYLKEGQVGTHYSAVLVLLLRLRQAACHPHLLKDFGIAAAAEITQEEVINFAEQLTPQVVERIKATGGNFECPVCYDAVSNPAIFIPCGHDTCRECFSRITDPANGLRDGMENGGGAKCPNCRGPIDTKRVTDFDAFKKVHMPELLTDKEREELEQIVKEEEEEEENDDDDSETESEDEDDDEEEVDENGNLKDFINDRDDEEVDVKPRVKDLANDDEDSETESEAEEDNGLHKEAFAGPSKKPTKAFTNPFQVKTTKGKKGKGKKPVGKKEPKKRKEKKKLRNKAVTLADLAKNSHRNTGSRKKYLRLLRQNYVDSAKIRKTMELLQQIVNDPEGEKVLVFSQWTSLLDLLEIPIDGMGWGYRRYDGSMNTTMRGDAVDDFRDHTKNVRIMLVSLKAGNAGLNLNMASQVIILDPFWNPFIEEQAIDRAHRIGQLRPVQVHRILVANTVEDRIIELQEKKRALIGEALDEKAGQNIARLGTRELAYLFGVTNRL